MSFKNHFFILMTIFTAYASSVQAIKIKDVKDYFTHTVPKPDNYHFLWFWCGANEGIGNLPEEDVIICNQPIERGITPLQIAALLKSEDWLIFLLESGQHPFTEIIALREKIEQACQAKTIPELTQADKLNLNQPLNVQGQTALDLATQAENFDLVEQLKKLGALEEHPDIDEIINLEYVKKNCDKEAFEEFLEWRSEKKISEANSAGAEREIE